MSSSRSVALSALLLTGCGTWQVQPVSPRKALSDSQYVGKTLRLTTMENEHIVLRDVQLRGEHIVGREGYSSVTIPVAKVRQVATRRISPGRTVGLIAGTAAALGVAFLIAILSHEDSS
jgi:hypothetical protein